MGFNVWDLGLIGFRVQLNAPSEASGLAPKPKLSKTAQWKAGHMGEVYEGFRGLGFRGLGFSHMGEVYEA